MGAAPGLCQRRPHPRGDDPPRLVAKAHAEPFRGLEVVAIPPALAVADRGTVGGAADRGTPGCGGGAADRGAVVGVGGGAAGRHSGCGVVGGGTVARGAGRVAAAAAGRRLVLGADGWTDVGVGNRNGPSSWSWWGHLVGRRRAAAGMVGRGAERVAGRALEGRLLGLVGAVLQ